MHVRTTVADYGTNFVRGTASAKFESLLACNAKQQKRPLNDILPMLTYNSINSYEIHKDFFGLSNKPKKGREEEQQKSLVKLAMSGQCLAIGTTCSSSGRRTR